MKEADAAGRRRKRIKNTGYLIPFFHNDVDGEGTNVIEYRMENKALTVICGLGYSTTLQVVLHIVLHKVVLCNSNLLLQ